MSVVRIILLIIGILFILGSIPLTFGGGTLLWMDLTQKDDDGFITTETDQLERDSYAIVTEPADIDLDEGWNVGWGWGWNVARDLGDLVTFKVEGSNNDDSKGIFIGVAQESDLMDYLNDVEYDEIIHFSIHSDGFDVAYGNHPGNSSPTAPTSETFWIESVSGTGTQVLEWELETGTYSLLLMNEDGSSDVDVDVSVGVKAPWIFGVGIGFVVGGIGWLIGGILLVILAFRGRKRSQPA
jgi:hypothetical protein